MQKAGESLMPLLEGGTAISLRESLARLASSESNLVLLGQFKRGKSTIANCLLGRDLLPYAAVPLTGLVTEVRFGETEEIVVHYNDGGEARFPLTFLSGFVSERENPRNVKNVGKIVVFCGSAFLKRGVLLIDTPGFGSTFVHNTQTTETYLKNCDAAVFVMSADSPLSLEEVGFIRQVRAYAPKIIFVLNKVDYLSSEDAAEVRTHIGGELAKIGVTTRLIPLSARLALDAILNRNNRAIRKSGIRELERTIIKFLSYEKEDALLESVRLKLMAASCMLHNKLASEHAALQLDSESLQEKIAEFKEESVSAVKSGRMRLAGIDEEFSGILSEITGDLESAKQSISRKIYAKIRREIERSRVSANSRLAELTDILLRQCIEKELSDWWKVEDGKIHQKIRVIESEYSKETEKIGLKLSRISEGIFDFKLKQLPVECTIDYDTDFYFKIDGVNPASLAPNFEMLLPNPLFRKRLLGNLNAKVNEELEINCGRIRYDYLQRLKTGKENFQKLQAKALEEMILQIEEGFKSGLQLASSSISEKSGRAEYIKAQLDVLDEINKEFD